MKIVPYKPDKRRFFQEITPRVAAWHIAHQQEDLFLMEPESDDVYELIRTIGDDVVVVKEGRYDYLHYQLVTRFLSDVYTIRKKL